MIDPKIKTLLALVECGNYTKTAKQLALTQPAITHHIKLLEEEFGIKIFYKNRRQLVPTPEGEVLIKYARRAYALSENLRQALSDVRSQVKSLTLAITPTAQNNIVPHLFAKYCNEHPNVHINIITDNINHLYIQLKMYAAELAIIQVNNTSQHITSIILDTHTQ